MSKLFTFGCSFTNFKYPTYADYLAPYFETHSNFGFPGSGNKSIFHKISYLLHKNVIQKEDVITIQWSALAREDKLLNDGEWVGGGLITNTPLYDENYIKKHFSVKQKAYELLSYITTILPTIRNKNIKIKWFYMLEPWFSDMLGEPGGVPDILVEQYVEVFKSGIIEEIKSLCSDSDYMGSIESFSIDSGYLNFRNKPTYYFEDLNNIYQDDHPPQYIHYLFSKNILKSLNIEINDKDEFLYNNSLEWTDYITNKKLLYESEVEFLNKNGEKIKYHKNQHPTLKWPSTNTKIQFNLNP